MFKASEEGKWAVVRRATVEDELHADIISQRLRDGVPLGAWGVWDTFGRLCSQTVKSEGLPFDPAGMHTAAKPELDAAYAAYLKLTKTFKNRWLKACDEADKPASNDVGVERLPEDADPNA